MWACPVFGRRNQYDVNIFVRQQLVATDRIDPLAAITVRHTKTGGAT
jgi:hypothetical protein